MSLSLNELIEKLQDLKRDLYANNDKFKNKMISKFPDYDYLTK